MFYTKSSNSLYRINQIPSNVLMYYRLHCVQVDMSHDGVCYNNGHFGNFDK